MKKDIDERRFLNAVEFVNMCKKIMEILPNERVSRETLEELINYNEDKDQFFLSALENLKSQKVITYDTFFISRKKSYSKWYEKICDIKRNIIESFIGQEFVSKEYLIKHIKNWSKCSFAINDLVSERKIIETREKCDGIHSLIVAYRLI